LLDNHPVQSSHIFYRKPVSHTNHKSALARFWVPLYTSQPMSDMADIPLSNYNARGKIRAKHGMGQASSSSSDLSESSSSSDPHPSASRFGERMPKLSRNPTKATPPKTPKARASPF